MLKENKVLSVTTLSSFGEPESSHVLNNVPLSSHKFCSNQEEFQSCLPRSNNIRPIETHILFTIGFTILVKLNIKGEGSLHLKNSGCIFIFFQLNILVTFLWNKLWNKLWNFKMKPRKLSWMTCKKLLSLFFCSCSSISKKNIIKLEEFFF